MRKLYRVHCGKTPLYFHSYRDLSDEDHALAYLWAMAHSSVPEICWYWQGLDGWMNNKHMAKKKFPDRLADLCKFYLLEDQQAISKP